jgi:5-hydroxyisourate hydrolase
MPDDGPTISTHVLDMGTGRPAPGVRVTVERVVHDGAAIAAGEGVTDADGRVRRLLASALTTGAYRVSFHLEDLGRFFRHVTLELSVDDATRSYHVPLLLAPFGITTYRGS